MRWSTKIKLWLQRGWPATEGGDVYFSKLLLVTNKEKFCFKRTCVINAAININVKTKFKTQVIGDVVGHRNFVA